MSDRSDSYEKQSRPLEERLDSVIADYIRVSEAGGSPDRLALMQQFPELAAELKQFFAQRDQLNQLAKPNAGQHGDLRNMLEPTQYLSNAANHSSLALGSGYGARVATRSRISDSSHHGRFLPGTKLADRYRIVSMLGRGGMGEVYRADDLRLGQTVALKFLPPELAKDSKRLEYFHQEVKLARQISHPNICRVYDIGEVNGQHFLSMEYIDGEDLKVLLRRIGRLPKDKGIQIARQLCSGLSAAHAKGVLHRDLKPANIMIDGQGQVRITDFGLAAISAAGEHVMGLSGTPAYMAPEQLLHGQTSARTDIYSLGLILFEVFTGQPAHEANSLAELRRLHEDSSSACSPSDIVDDIDPAVERAISRCLASDPSMRPRTVSELSASLPGGDPLAAALAAGETPHPEIVAMSGDSKPLPMKTALWLVGLFMAGLLLYMVGRERLDKLNSIEPFLSPQVLVYRSQNILAQLGYESLVKSGDFSFGFDDMGTQDGNTLIAKRPGYEAWPKMGFWYRESPTEFKADTLGLGISRGGAAQVDFWYPAWTLSGMQGVRLDNAGKLRWFEAIPPMELNDVFPTEPTPWTEWFTQELTGFQLTELRTIKSKVVPPVVYDQLQAWSGTWPGTEKPLTVVAAAFAGCPVYFEILAEPNQRASEYSLAGAAGIALIVGSVFRWLLLIIAAVLIARNLFLRRWDRRGAKRLVLFSFLIFLFSVLCQAHHVWSVWEFAVLINCIAATLFDSGWIWVHYVALEPTVRRYWPELLISWSRLLGGRITDARVGSDLLAGAVVGVGMSLCGLLRNVVDAEYQFLHDPQSFLGPLLVVGQALSAISLSTRLLLGSLFAMVVLRVILRNKMFAVGIAFAFYGTIYSLLEPIYLWPIVLAQVGLMTFAGLRLGLLGASMAGFAYISTSEITTVDPGRFYFWNNMITTSIVGGIVVFAFVSAVGGWQILSRPQRVAWQP